MFSQLAASRQHARDRRVRDHCVPVRHVPEHRRPGREEPAPTLRRQHEPNGVAEYGSIGYSSRPPSASTIPSPIPNGPEAVRFGDFRRGAQFVNSLFNGKILSRPRRPPAGLQARHLQGAALAEDGAGHVRHEARDADATGVDRIRPPEQRRVGQGRLLRPEARRNRLLLALSDRPVQPPNIVGPESHHGGRHQRGQAAARDLQPERPEQHCRHAGRAARCRSELVPLAGRIELQRTSLPICRRPSTRTTCPT